MSDDLGNSHGLGSDDGSSRGFYLLLGVLAVAVAVIFVVLSGHHSLVGGGRDMMRVETPHAQLNLPQPPVMGVKYQSKICSPVQNKTPSCRTA
jgi:hypothetical protein